MLLFPVLKSSRFCLLLAIRIHVHTGEKWSCVRSFSVRLSDQSLRCAILLEHGLRGGESSHRRTSTWVSPKVPLAFVVGAGATRSPQRQHYFRLLRDPETVASGHRF